MRLVRSALWVFASAALLLVVQTPVEAAVIWSPITVPNGDFSTPGTLSAGTPYAVTPNNTTDAGRIAASWQLARSSSLSATYFLGNNPTPADGYEVRLASGNSSSLFNMGYLIHDALPGVTIEAKLYRLTFQARKTGYSNRSYAGFLFGNTVSNDALSWRGPIDLFPATTSTWLNEYRIYNSSSVLGDTYVTYTMLWDNRGNTVPPIDEPGAYFTSGATPVHLGEPLRFAVTAWDNSGGTPAQNMWDNFTVDVEASAAPPPSIAYWRGDSDGSWKTNASGATNWATTNTGATDTGAIPDTVSDVIFAVDTGAGGGNYTTTLDQNVSIKSLRFKGTGTDVAGTSVTIASGTGGPYTLTVGSGGMYVEPGSAAHTISANIALGTGFAGWDNDSSNTFTISGNISNGAIPLVVGGSGSSVISGIIGNGAGGLTKNGAGTLTLNGANTYTGPTIVNNGALIVGATGSISASSAVTVNANGSLGGTGAINGLVSVVGGTVSPGNSPGVQTYGGGINFSAAGVYAWQLGDYGTVAGTDSDLLDITGGNLVLGGTSVLNITFVDGVTDPDSGNPFWLADHIWKIIDVIAPGGSNPGNTDFASMLNAAFLSGSFATSVATTGDDTGDVFLTYTAASAVPEPSSMALGICGLSALVGMAIAAWRRTG